MGSVSIIHAESHMKDLSGVILLDPMLHTQSAFARGAGAQTRAPWPLFTPSAYIATCLYGLPYKSSDAFSKLCSLNIPILLIQDPDDPVAIARFSRNAAATNSKIRYWEAPKVSRKHPALREHGGWGSHVTAYGANICCNHAACGDKMHKHLRFRKTQSFIDENAIKNRHCVTPLMLEPTHRTDIIYP